MTGRLDQLIARLKHCIDALDEQRKPAELLKRCREIAPLDELDDLFAPPIRNIARCRASSVFYYSGDWPSTPTEAGAMTPSAQFQLGQAISTFAPKKVVAHKNKTPAQAGALRKQSCLALLSVLELRHGLQLIFGSIEDRVIWIVLLLAAICARVGSTRAALHRLIRELQL